MPIALNRKRKTALWLGLGAGMLLFIGANAHLVYVALTSQPDCIAHVRQGESNRSGGQYSAARSSCAPP